MSDGRRDREAKLPTEEELSELPRWARVAYAARCARRVRPLFKHFWPEAPEEHIEAVDNACRLSAASAAYPAAVARAAAAARTAAIFTAAYDAANPRFVAAAAVARSAVAYAAAYAAADARSAAAAATAARSVTDAYAFAYALTEAAYASSASDAAARRDFNLLHKLAQGAASADWGERTPWTDETPVDPDLLGPLWPFGEPEGWPEEAREPRAGDRRIRIKLTAPPHVSDEESAAAMAELVRRMDDLQRAMGGSGLIIDDEANAFDERLVLQPSGGGA